MKPAASKRLAELRDEVRDEQRRKPKARAAKPASRRRRKKLTWKSFAIGCGKAAAIVLLPFLLYVRSSVWLYSTVGVTPWLAVAGALFLTLIVVAGYAGWIVHGFFGKAGLKRIAQRVVAPIVGGWLLYSLVFLASVNAKSDDVRSWYSSLHPVLRVAVSTAIILDRDMVITDMQRVAADYPRMGLKVNPTTRHYVQKDGWVHAVDLRTNGRSELRNRALQAYFWSTGFSTTRHVGTSDHLHIQLQ